MNNDNKKVTMLRKVFSPEEDAHLKLLVDRIGMNNWKEISRSMIDRTPRQCRERYKNYLAPQIINGPWSAEEDKLLFSKYAELGRKWSAISKFFMNRSNVNIKNRWASLNLANSPNQDLSPGVDDETNEIPSETIQSNEKFSNPAPNENEKKTDDLNLYRFGPTMFWSRPLTDPSTLQQFKIDESSVDEVSQNHDKLSQTFKNYAGRYW